MRIDVELTKEEIELIKKQLEVILFRDIRIFNDEQTKDFYLMLHRQQSIAKDIIKKINPLIKYNLKLKGIEK